MLGSRIEELLASEMEANFVAGAAGGGGGNIPDEAKQRQLLLEDEEEDFMDEGNTRTHKKNLISLLLNLFPLWFISQCQSQWKQLSNGVTIDCLRPSPGNHHLHERNLQKLAENAPPGLLWPR